MLSGRAQGKGLVCVCLYSDARMRRRGDGLISEGTELRTQIPHEKPVSTSSTTQRAACLKDARMERYAHLLNEEGTQVPAGEPFSMRTASQRRHSEPKLPD